MQKKILPFFVVIIIDAMGFGMVAPVLAPLVMQPHSPLWAAGTSNEARHLIYGILLGISPLCFFIGAPLIGYWSDYCGRRRMLLVCLLGTLIGYVFYSLSFIYFSLTLLFFGRMLLGFSTGSQAIAQAVMADMSSGESKTVNIGLIATAMTIGLVAGPFLGGVFSDQALVSWFSLKTPFLVAIFFAIFNIYLLWRYVPRVNLSLLEKKIKNKTKFLKALLGFIQIPGVSLLVAIFFLFELGWSLYFQSMALYLVKDFGYSHGMIGIFSAYIGVSLSISLLFLVRWATHRFGLIKIVFYSLLVMVAALLVAYCFNKLPLQWLMVIPATFAVGIIYASLVTKISNMAAQAGQGLLMGATDAVLSLAFAITGLLAGYLAYFQANLPLLAAAGFTLLALLLSGYAVLSKFEKKYGVV